MALRMIPGTTEKQETYCNLCAVQCGMRLWLDPSSQSIIGSEGNELAPTTRGLMCIKGMNAHEQVHHPDRLTSVMIRRNGRLEPASWDEGFALCAQKLRGIQAAHGAESVAVFGGGALTNEKAYLLGKFARLALKTPHIDYNGRYCMSCAAAAGNKAFGIDRGLPFPVSDIPLAECLIVVGSNIFDTLPPLSSYLIDARNRGSKIIVVDPRRTETARIAALHLPIRPSTDLALANGLLHLLIASGQIDATFIAQRTTGFEAVREAVKKYDPKFTAEITGLPESAIIQAAEFFGTADSGMILTARGAEQQTKGVDTVLAFINIVLATGKIGRPGCGYGALTGQGNGQGGREHGQKADQLPGYRSINNPEHRKSVAAVWGVSEESLPGAGKSAQEIFNAVVDGSIRGLFVMGSNPAVSAPRGTPIREAFSKLDFLAVADFFPSEMVETADVVFPAAIFAEEEGTITNLEGRVIHRQKIIDPPGQARTDIDILCGLAAALGEGRFFDFHNSRSVFEELRRASKGGIADYSGITYERIDETRGIFWPCPSEDHPGSPRLFETHFAFPDGKARFHAVEHRNPPEVPDDDYPLVLTTGRVLQHYLTGVQTHRIKKLEKACPEPFVEIHPDLAHDHKVGEGDPVRLVSRRGEMVVAARLSANIRKDTVFVPFHWGGAKSVNQLTLDVWDPVSKMPGFKHCAVRLERI